MIKKFIFIVALTVVLILSGCSDISTQGQTKEQVQESIVQSDKHYKIVDQGDSVYQYTIFDNNSEIVIQSEHFGIIPIIKYIELDMIEVTLQAGSNIYYCTYYDIVNNKISGQFTTPIANGYGKIAYLDYDKKPYILVVCDLFDPDSYYKEFSLDFSPVVAPVLDAEFTDEYSFWIRYESGEDQEEKSVDLSLK